MVAKLHRALGEQLIDLDFAHLVADAVARLTKIDLGIDPGDVAGVCSGGEDLNGDGAVGGSETDPDMVDTDCDGDQIPDSFQAEFFPAQFDCNGNGIHDTCYIRDGTSQDENGNGVPDECET